VARSVAEWLQTSAKRASEACKVCKCHGFSRGYLQLPRILRGKRKICISYNVRDIRSFSEA